MKTKTLSVLVAAAVMTACASTPGPRPVAAPAAPPAPPVSLTKVYFYPTAGQTEAQQDRDRYECHNWSVRQTSFDPSRHLPPGELRATVVPARSPDHTVGAAAAVGAVIGAIAADRGDSAKGAVIGAMAGAVLGSAAASAERSEARRVEAQPVRGYGRYEKEAAEFRRAMSACLEGRGYSVK
jgi:hypothetical protein